MAAFESAHRGKAGGAPVATSVAQAGAARQTVSSPARAEHPVGDFGAVRVRDTGDSMYDTRRSLVASFGPGARDVPIDVASDQARGAEGMTQGRRVHLAPGRFAMHSRTGMVLLGHEVAHALQQRRGEGLTSPLAGSERAALEAEAEQAGHAFADGRTFAVTGRAPAAALYRGPDDEPQQAIADIEFDAVMQKVLARQVARGLSIASARKSRLEYLRAHREWREIDVPVDDRLRKLSPMQQWHELNLRLLETVFPSITRPDAEELLRRLHWRAHETGDAKLAAMIQTQDKINYRTQDIEIAAEIYNQIEEGRRLADINLDERLNNGYDYSLEIFKDVGRSYYNGALSFGQGLVDLPAAPVNLVQTLRGEEPVHLLNLDSLRARYHTGWGLHQGHSAELGVNLALTVVSGKLPAGGAGGAGAAANTASTVSRAARLYAAWSKLSAVTSGATAVVQAGQALRDLARGYVVVDGKQRPLTDDDIVDRLVSIAFGAHTAKSLAGGRKGEAEKSGTAGQARPEPHGMAVEHPTPTSVVVSAKGEPFRLVLDESGWRVVGADGKTLRSGPPDEGASIASALGAAPDAVGAPATSPIQPPSRTASPAAPQSPPTLQVLPGDGQGNGIPTGLVRDSDQANKSVRVDASHPIFKNRTPANDQTEPPAPQAQLAQAGTPAATQTYVGQIDPARPQGTTAQASDGASQAADSAARMAAGNGERPSKPKHGTVRPSQTARPNTGSKPAAPPSSRKNLVPEYPVPPRGLSRYSNAELLEFYDANRGKYPKAIREMIDNLLASGNGKAPTRKQLVDIDKAIRNAHTDEANRRAGGSDEDKLFVQSKRASGNEGERFNALLTGNKLLNLTGQTKSGELVEFDSVRLIEHRVLETKMNLSSYTTSGDVLDQMRRQATFAEDWGFSQVRWEVYDHDSYLTAKEAQEALFDLNPELGSRIDVTNPSDSHR